MSTSTPDELAESQELLALVGWLQLVHSVLLQLALALVEQGESWSDEAQASDAYMREYEDEHSAHGAEHAAYWRGRRDGFEQGAFDVLKMADSVRVLLGEAESPQR